MKAPTADYSPLSQALSAVTSANQASYSAKDASNWSNRYQIQQQSFDLQSQSYDLQQEAIDDSRLQSIFNFISEAGQTIYSVMTGNISQKATVNATNLSTDFKSQLDLNEDYTQIIENEDGTISVGLSEKGIAAWNKTKEKYFPSGERYGWGMDKTVNNLVDSTYASLNSYGTELAVSRAQQSTEQNYSSNLSHALEFDLQSGETTTFDIDDGAGGTRTVTVGAQQAKVILSRSNSMGQAWTDSQLVAAAESRRTALGNNILADINKSYSDGSYLSDSNAWSASDAQIEAYLNTITDPSDRLEAEENIKAAKTSAVTTYFEDIENSILAQDKDSYKALSKLYDDVTDKEGDIYKFFTETKYIDPVTYSSVRNQIKSSLETIESSAGTVNTNAVQNGFKTYNAQYKAGQLSATEYAVRIDNLMATTYCNDDGTPNYNWRENTEALKVCQTQLFEMLPDDITSDDSFKTSWTVAWQNALNMGDSTLYKDLTPEQQETANIIQADMMQEIYKAVLKDPSVAIDAKSYADALNDISRRYNAKWIDYINTDVSKTNMFDTLTGAEATDMVKKGISGLVSADSTGILNSITSSGYLDRTGDNFLPGVNDKINETVTLIGTYGRAVEGLNIENPNTGILKFKMGEDGNPSLDKKGQPILESVRWTGITLPNGDIGTVTYDVESDSWVYGDGKTNEERIQEDEILSTDRLMTQHGKIAMHDRIDGKVPESLQVRNSADSGTSTDSATGTIGSPLKTATLSSKVLKEVDTFIQKKKRVTTEDEETGDEIVTEVPAVDETDIRDFIGTHADSEAEISAYITEFRSLHRDGKLMSDISGKEFDKLMESIRYSLKNYKER